MKSGSATACRWKNRPFRRNGSSPGSTASWGSGVDIIQVGSFVHPAKVPQMADTDRLFAQLRERGLGGPGVVFSALVLNEKGLERGLACGVEMFCMGVSASETHSKKNTGMSSMKPTVRIIAMAKAASGGKDGPGLRSVRLRLRLRRPSAPRTGCWGSSGGSWTQVSKTISLADTAGHAVPDQVERMFPARPRNDANTRSLPAIFITPTASVWPTAMRR